MCRIAYVCPRDTPHDIAVWMCRIAYVCPRDTPHDIAVWMCRIAYVCPRDTPHDIAVQVLQPGECGQLVNVTVTCVHAP